MKFIISYVALISSHYNNEDRYLNKEILSFQSASPIAIDKTGLLFFIGFIEGSKMSLDVINGCYITEVDDEGYPL